VFSGETLELDSEKGVIRMTQNIQADLRIVRAAIREQFGGIHSVPIPGRHHDIIRNMREAGYVGSVYEKGFMLSDGQFVTRKAAKILAVKNGQLKTGVTNLVTLTSEDLW